MKRLFLAFIALSLFSALLVGCDGVSSSSSASSYTVQMANMVFTQTSMSIPRGSSLTLVNDASDLHILANGIWMNGNAHIMHEQGMPSMTGKGSQTIGPFPTPGMYHLYCIIHPGMNLTIVVQ